MSTAVFSLINSVDEVFSSFVPLIWRVSFWGLFAGVAAMVIYAFASNQQVISALKKETKELRSRLLSVESRSEYTVLAGKNLKVSVRLLGRVTIPALLSVLPVLVIAGWMDAYHAEMLLEGLFSHLPRWASGWELPYFFSVTLGALAIKLVFKIH
jgi:hypothetical protein